MSGNVTAGAVNTHNNWHKNLPLFVLLAMLPLAAIVQGSIAFWTQHYEFSVLGSMISRDGQSAEMLGLVMTSLGWMALWALAPLLGAPKRCAVCMSSLAVVWTLLFFTLSA